LDYPPITLDFVRALTDDKGIFQHAKFGTPRRRDGYTTDDNARALISITKYNETVNSTEDVDRLLDTYLSFLLLMQRDDGRMHNLLSYDQRFIDDVGSEDCMGRTLWSCGYIVGSNLCLERRLLAKEIFDMLLPWAVKSTSPRAVAFAVMGLVKYQTAFRADLNPMRSIESLVEKLLKGYNDNRIGNWRWFEPYLTYCNGRLSQALFEANKIVPNEAWLKTALESLDFLLEVQTVNNVFVPIGNRGWYYKDGQRTIYDQQAVEAAVMTEAALSAFYVTGRNGYRTAAETIFNWFLGENTLGAPVYNSDKGGCYDGITPQGLNLNMGSEAIVCYLSARLEMESLITRTSLQLSIG
jgi:hypothetical protein